MVNGEFVCRGDGYSVWEDEKVIKMEVVMFAQRYGCIYCYWAGYLKVAKILNFMSDTFYHNFLKKELPPWRNPNWRTVCETPEQVLLKLSRSARTRNVWETVPGQSRLGWRNGGPGWDPGTGKGRCGEAVKSKWRVKGSLLSCINAGFLFVTSVAWLWRYEH